MIVHFFLISNTVLMTTVLNMMSVFFKLKINIE